MLNIKIRDKLTQFIASHFLHNAVIRKKCMSMHPLSQLLIHLAPLVAERAFLSHFSLHNGCVMLQVISNQLYLPFCNIINSLLFYGYMKFLTRNLEQTKQNYQERTVTIKKVKDLIVIKKELSPYQVNQVSALKLI